MPVRVAEEDIVDGLEDDKLPEVLEAIPLLLAKPLGKLAMEEIGLDDGNGGTVDVVGARTGVEVEDDDGVAWLA